MKVTSNKASFFLIALLALAAIPLLSSSARAQSSYFTSRGCVDCHAAPVVATCNGCHAHGAHGASIKTTINISGTTNKTSYAPGETVSVTIAGGYRTGWVRATLYNQNQVELARSTGNASGMGSSTTLPAVLTAPAPTTPGTYTWKVAWYGNINDSATAVFGAGWSLDPNNSEHGQEIVNTNTFTVVSAGDTTVPVVGAFTLPATATSLTVPVSSFTATDNLAVTGYLVTASATAPTAAAAGWSATAPATVTAAAAGTVTFYAWAKDAAGNISIAKNATVTITLPPAADTTKPTLTISALANGTLTNKVTLNISGTASDAGGIKSVTVNGLAVIVSADGSFSTALTLVAGANTITTIATDNAGNQTTDSRIVTHDANAPVLTVAAPADNSTTTQSFITLTGTISESSTVSFSVNGGTPQSAAITGSTFSATAYLVAGVNTISITATDLAGNIATAKRTVTYSATTNSLGLAVTYPSQDITTQKSRIEIRGKATDALSNVTVRITMDGRTYIPKMEDDGKFVQKLVFTKPMLYAITITATDEAGNSSSIIRNVIYRPITTEEERDDD